ncbi:MAG: hypothetical protein LBD58_02030 [Treponema sp.]|jgi:hypothetical protein|nr:hypothetical protein [Treponema sp.]
MSHYGGNELLLKPKRGPQAFKRFYSRVNLCQPFYNFFLIFALFLVSVSASGAQYIAPDRDSAGGKPQTSFMKKFRRRDPQDGEAFAIQNLKAGRQYINLLFLQDLDLLIFILYMVN